MKPCSIYRDIYIIGSSEISHPYDCCVYMIDTHPDLVLIDSGAGKSFGRLVENIKALRCDPANLKAIIATHAHIDHIGALHDFQEKFGVKVLAHELDADAIETGRRTAAELYGINYQPCNVDVKIKEPEKALSCGKYELRVLHIPGHTPGSIVVHTEIAGKRVLFGQDIHGPYHLEGADTVQAKASLKKLIELRADLLCEGHFGVYEPAGVVMDYIERCLKTL